MKINLKTLALITTLGAAVVVGGCKNNSSSPLTGGAISPTGSQPAKNKSSVPKNYVKLKEGTPAGGAVTAIVASGGDVDVRDSATNQSIWAGRVNPNTVITVGANGVQVGGLQKNALKNPRNKHAIYFVNPRQF